MSTAYSLKPITRKKATLICQKITENRQLKIERKTKTPARRPGFIKLNGESMYLIAFQITNLLSFCYL